MKDNWVMHLSLTNQHGEQYVKAIKLSDDAICSGMTPRLRDEIDLAAEVGMSVMSFDAAIDMIKRREFRREFLFSVARHLAIQMADYMEDAEGWHGIDRAEKVSVLAKEGKIV